MKKVLLTAVFAAFCLAACSTPSDTYIINNVAEEASKTEKTYSIKKAKLDQKIADIRKYVASTDKIVTDCQIPLGFMAGKEDIPYIPMESDVLNRFTREELYEVSDVTASGTQVEIENKLTKAKAVIDLLHRKIVFDDYDAFFQNNQPYFDVAELTNKNINYIKIISASNIAGKPLTLYWGGFKNIDIVVWRRDGKNVVALPLQSFSDIFLANLNKTLFYNGTNLYFNIDPDPIKDEYYSAAPTGKRSKYLADFCYDELCLNLDLNYGLKTIHGIDKFSDFDEFFGLAGVRDALKAEDSLDFSNAVKDVCGFYFNDGHSVYLHNSWRLGKNIKVPGTKPAYMDNEYNLNSYKYIVNGRNQEIGDQSRTKIDPVPCYEVSGDTVIVRFDHFSDNDSSIDALNMQLAGFDVENAKYAGGAMEEIVETAAMIHAVNEKIKALDDTANKIENVVLDLSCNGGGSCRTALFVMSWMLGESSSNNLNPITGAKWTATYKADVDFNGLYNDRDTIKDKNLFCLVSPVSFSCGNMVPAMLKASGRVTILGVTSGGGTSVVQPSCAADGTVFQFSSKCVMSAIKNGSIYDIDRGVEPHYTINDPCNFYNKDKIAALVHDINDAKLGNVSTTTNP